MRVGLTLCALRAAVKEAASLQTIAKNFQPHRIVVERVRWQREYK